MTLKCRSQKTDYSLKLLTSWLLIASSPLQVALAAEPHLILRYDFEKSSIKGDAVEDVSGNGRKGQIVNRARVNWIPGPEGKTAIALSGGPANSQIAPYIHIPPGLFEGVSAVTVSTWIKWDGGQPFQWAYDLGKTEGDGIFFTPWLGQKFGARALIKEVTEGGELGLGLPGKLPEKTWVHLATVVDGKTMTFYVNGIKAGVAPATISLRDAFAAPDAKTSGLLGKALWPHPFFAGALDDFRVYNIAMSAHQIQALTGNQLPTIKPTKSPTQIITTIGMAPVLPATLDVMYSDGITRGLPVRWAAVTPEQYAQLGHFDLAGSVPGYPQTIQANVEVREPERLVVDLSKPTGAFNGGASGTLYGLYNEGLPSQNLVEGIKLRTVATKAQDGPQHPGGDALQVAKLLTDSSRGDTYIYMTDIFRNFPYKWRTGTCQQTIDAYMSKLEDQVRQTLTLPQKYRQRIVFVPWNEPEGNMFGWGDDSCEKVVWQQSPKTFFAAWDRSYKLIKSLSPDARIAGPGTSMLFTENKLFLEHVVSAGTIPDVMNWHELSNPARVRTSVQTYRQWETEVFAGTPYAGRHLPINLSEYAYNYHTSVPGQMVQWISAIEDMKVDADIAYWNIAGNLSDSAVQSNRGNGQWWLFNAYTQMTGQTVSVTPPHPNVSYTLQGLASFDSIKSQARVLLGGGDGKYTIDVKNLPAAAFGKRVHVSVKEIPWTGQLGESAPPRLLTNFTENVVNGELALTFGTGDLPLLKAESAYEVILSPGANATITQPPTLLWQQTLEAETAAHTGDGYRVNGPEGSPDDASKFYTSGGYHVGGFSTGSDVTLTFKVSVPQDGIYTLSVLANALNLAPKITEDGPTNIFVRVDGDEATEQQMFLPLGYKWTVWDHSDTPLKLSKGPHSISISTHGANGHKTKGEALIDRITLTLPNLSTTDRVYEAENAEIEKGTIDYSRAGVSGAGFARLDAGGTATFWVYSAKSEPSKLNFDTFGTGPFTTTVNGQVIADRSISAIVLSGGINKVVVEAPSGNLSLDRLRVSTTDKPFISTVYAAEGATLSGDAKVEALSQAKGGKAITGIGGSPGNNSSLTFENISVAQSGIYALTIRYSNEEQAQATHYNPDPLARTARISINGAAPVLVTFPHTFHKNNFWELTIPVVLKTGRNAIKFSGEEQTNFDGKTYASDTWKGLQLRSKLAPNIDQIEIAPYGQ